MTDCTSNKIGRSKLVIRHKCCGYHWEKGVITVKKCVVECKFAAMSLCCANTSLPIVYKMKRCEILLVILLLVVLTGCQRSDNKDVLLLHVVRGGFLGLFDTYLVASDGTGETSTNLPSRLGREPRWSFDGQWIVFTDKQNEDGLVLHFMRSDGSHHIKYQPRT